MANFEIAYKKTSIHEGGYANVSGDRGGETYKGISRKMHPNWSGWSLVDRHKPLKHNEFIKDPYLDTLVKEFYKKNFWDKIKGDDIEYQLLADFWYDYYVHSGARSSKKLQVIVGFTGNQVDGIVGKNTLSRVNVKDAHSIFLKLKGERKTFLTNLSKQSGQSKFLKGWMNRINSY